MKCEDVLFDVVLHADIVNVFFDRVI